MSKETQAEAYLQEARLTRTSTVAIFERAQSAEEPLWAAVVKNGYDAMEQAIPAAIATTGERIPRDHPGKIQMFIEHYEPGDELTQELLYWLRRRSEAQYVDVIGDQVNVPHERFDAADARRMLTSVETVIKFVNDVIEESQ